MIRHILRTLFYSAAVLLLCAGPNLYGQQNSTDIQQLSDLSIASFEKGDYRLALSGFRKLIDLEKGEAQHRYYAGRCLVELNEELDEAIELLYGASQKNVPRDVTFYLGMAYHRYYNFREAHKYFEKFGVSANRQEKKEYNIKHHTATTRSAGEITSAYNPFEVLNVTFMDLFDSLQYSQVKMKGGQLSRKPDAYMVGDEDPSGLSNLMFIPSNPVRGDYLYFSGYSKSGKGGTQLFRVRKGAGRSWSAPEEVAVLNSDGNEILPYFDPIEEDLYFASDGYFGIGGFDLYRSHYDSERDQWTEPMNLGFPVNSVMDEYLLLPGSDLGLVLFFSTRQGTDSTVTVYRVLLSEPKKKTAANDERMLREIAQLGGVAEDILAELQNMERSGEAVRRESESGNHLPVAAAVPLVVSAPVAAAVPVASAVPTKGATDTESISAYQFYLAEALSHQALSDSLKDLAFNARRRVRESDDPNDRWVWQKQIMVWEKRAHDEEAMADYLYSKMEVERASQSSNPAVNPPETIMVDTVIENLTVYRYVVQTTDLEGEPGTRPSRADQTSVQPAGQPRSVPINRFDILTPSPYTISNPIPMDVALPEGTFYRIQLGAFGSMVNPGEFGGISPITGERLKERGIIKYYAGKFSRYEDASAAMPRIQSIGYEDAFIVAWYNGMQVSTQKAKQLE
jgi:tetratricopeptide (TPR) repeat protein